MELTRKTVYLFPNPGKTLPAGPVQDVARILRSMGLRASVSDRLFASDLLPYLPIDEGFTSSDLVIVFGGDGTMMRAARFACARAKKPDETVPLLGINFGTVGYMTELERDELDLLNGLHHAHVQTRMLSDALVSFPNGTNTGPCLAINETVICRGQAGKIIRLKLFCDGHEVSNYRADGMIFSTPTGSSAYNLSAGGPIIDPKLNAFAVCPLAAFTLSSVHPMVFSPSSILEVAVEGDAVVTCDGKQVASLPYGGRLGVSRSASVLRLVDLKNTNFYEVLNRKLS